MSDDPTILSGQPILLLDTPTVAPPERAPIPFLVRGPLAPNVGAEFIADLEAIDPVFQCQRPTEEQRQWKG